MFKIDWTSLTIQSNADAEHMRRLYKESPCTAAAFDAEADGLNIMRCRPFLYQFGWYDRATLKGYTFAVDIERQPVLAKQVIKVWQSLVKTAPIYLGANVKFDLHMVANMGLPYREDNVSDLQMWIRLGTDAIPERFGGAPLALKKFTARFIDASAQHHEKKIKAERTAIAKDLNNKLIKKLNWFKYQVDEFFKDPLNDASDLPPQKREAYEDWLNNDVPEYLRPAVLGAVDSDMIGYHTLNREDVIEYGHMDIVQTLEAYHLLQPIVETRGNLDGIKLEEANIYPNYDMERVGFKADREYLAESRRKVKEYIKIRRQDMWRIAGKEFSTGQHAVVKEVLESMGITVESTGADELDLLCSDLKRNADAGQAVDFIGVVQELRSLEKWYSTYICRFTVDLKYGDMLYTQINLSGAATGRVTCDFQQFPKGALKTVTGEVLFEPRRLFVVPDGYKAIVYLDYSQIELRVQALYTLLLGQGDLNLCRAYMPYKCHHCSTVPFNYKNPDHIRSAYTENWYLDESPTTLWTPTDVHGATTKAAFNIDENHPDYSDLRYVGKRVNFAKNYGAQRGQIKSMFPEYSDEDIDRINDAYYIAFPGVKNYHDYCYKLVKLQAYAENLFGVRYYNTTGHKLINILVQGSAAYILKTAIPRITKYLKDKGYKSVFQMQIHDELSFCWHEDDPPELFFELKEIMEDYPDFWVPVVADMEVTYTSWADKKGVKTIEDLT